VSTESPCKIPFNFKKIKEKKLKIKPGTACPEPQKPKFGFKEF
jgi:hypothetical protein